MTARTKLTPVDLVAVVADERHNGWGYATASYLSPTKRGRLDSAVVAVANELGLTYEDLLVWADSKYGRWLVDHASSTINRAVVREYLNPAALAVLREEVTS